MNYLKELKTDVRQNCVNLVIIGGINWGSIGLFKFDIVGWICGGQDAVISRIIYTLVALAAVWCISLLFKQNEILSSDNGEKRA